ncbi:hypothetical protein Q7C36_015785 [Tachysurus vachellii]|uniref:Uncharacterized protein n=1 Tax=Tachysurus vachellii TaxID=175792 RepID=A0AA88SC05_TACVA|nr:hypothetical protein Q7C36_015785 [Tachysurus vachellii]
MYTSILPAAAEVVQELNQGPSLELLTRPVDIESSKHSLWDVLLGGQPESQMKVTCVNSSVWILGGERRGAGPGSAGGLLSLMATRLN